MNMPESFEVPLSLAMIVLVIGSVLMGVIAIMTESWIGAACCGILSATVGFITNLIQR